MGGNGSDANKLRAEYDDQAEDEFQTEIYRQLEWVRREKGWKPGWTAWTFKDLFGRWPEKWMNTLTPYPACAAVEKLVRRRIRILGQQLKEGKERERDNRAPLLASPAPAEKANGLSRGNGKVEG